MRRSSVARRVALGYLTALCAWYGLGAETGTPGIEIETKASGPNNVFVLGDTIRFPAILRNKGAERRTVPVSLSLRDYFGQAIELPARNIDLEPGAQAEALFEFRPETTGHFTPVFRAGDAERHALPIGVVPEPVKGRRPLSIFGISGQLSRDRRDWELLRLMGVKWIRGDMAWPHFQQKRDEWRGGYDDVVKTAREMEIGIMATVGYTQNFAAQEFEWSPDFGAPPRWVAARHTAPVRTDCLPDWEQYCARLVQTYGDVVKYWEIWNEADLSFYYGTPGDYMAMHKAAWCAIRKADPQAPVLGGNSCICPYFIQRVIPDGFLAYTDIMSVHYPFNFDTPIEWNRPSSGYNRPYLERNGYRKALEMTEGGNLVYEGRGEPFGIKDATHKTRMLVKEHMFNCRQQQGKFYQFTFTGHLGWGFMPDDRQSPYPHFVSHAVMAHVLEDADYVGFLDLGQDISAFVFSRNMTPITVLWKGSYIVPAGEADTDFEPGAAQLVRVDLMGKQTQLQPDRSGKLPQTKRRLRHAPSQKRIQLQPTRSEKGGVYRIHLDQDPIYLIGGDRRLLARALAQRSRLVFSDLSRLTRKVNADRAKALSAGVAAEDPSTKDGLDRFQSPLSLPLDALFDNSPQGQEAIASYNVLHKLCDLAEVRWLEAGVAANPAQSHRLFRDISLPKTREKLAGTKSDLQKEWGVAIQPRVSDMLLRASDVVSLAERAAEGREGSLHGIALGRLAFANELLSTAQMLARFEPKVVCQVYLSLDLPSSVHWGGRWEKKLLIKPSGEPLTFPASATVHNRSANQTARGKLRLSAPQGWNVSPGTVEYEVAAQQDRTCVFNVTVPADAPFVPHEDDLRLHGDVAGDALFPATQQIEVTPPLWIEIGVAGAKVIDVRSAEEAMDITGTKAVVLGEGGKLGQSDVTAQLRNRDRRDWAGTVRLELPPGWASKPAEIAFDSIGHYKKVEAKFTLFYPPNADLGPKYPILARAVASDGKTIGLETTGTGGKWKFKVGSDPQWKEKDFDDAAWDDRVTDYYAQPGYAGDVWFRQKMFVPASWKDRDLLLNLGIPCMAIEVFFNGQRVGQLGEWPPEWCACWGDIANFTVKQEFVSPGAWNTVAVRVLVGYAMGGITPGFLRPVR